MKQLTKNVCLGFALLLAAALPRLTTLGRTLTVDEPLWIDRSTAFIEHLSTFQFARTLPSTHPGVTTAWLVGATSWIGTLQAAKATIAVASMALIGFSLYFLRYLWPVWWVWLAGFLLALDPFLIAHSRRVHTDALLALTLLPSILALLVFFERCRTARVFSDMRFIIYSGVFLGLAALTKVFALAALPIGFSLMLVLSRGMVKPVSVFVRSSSLWLAAFVVTVFAGLPALWVAPTNVLQNIYEGLSLHEEGTRAGEVTSYWWYYPREAVFRLTPPATLLFPVAVVGLWRYRKTSMGRNTAALLFSGLMYAVILSLKGEKSDRYILFTLITITLSSILGLRLMIDWLTKEWSTQRRWLRLAGAGGVVTYLAAAVIAIHPNYLTYYNPLYPIEVRHKLGWGEGLEEAARWVSANYPTTDVASYYPRVFQYWYTGHAQVNSTSHISDTATNIVVLYRAMFERAPDSPESDLIHVYLDQQQPLHTIYINGLPFVWVFEHKV